MQACAASCRRRLRLPHRHHHRQGLRMLANAASCRRHLRLPHRRHQRQGLWMQASPASRRRRATQSSAKIIAPSKASSATPTTSASTIRPTLPPVAVLPPRLRMMTTASTTACSRRSWLRHQSSAQSVLAEGCASIRARTLSMKCSPIRRPRTTVRSVLCTMTSFLKSSGSCVMTLTLSNALLHAPAISSLRQMTKLRLPSWWP
mmetsp:Transcript_37362/g.120371  ORF Transcript_37362/g.120371 Transcript_37362/m.120371 type:complete len:204 (-) Transcript_37362:261-872(-)